MLVLLYVAIARLGFGKKNLPLMGAHHLVPQLLGLGVGATTTTLFSIWFAGVVQEPKIDLDKLRNEDEKKDPRVKTDKDDKSLPGDKCTTKNDDGTDIYEGVCCNNGLLGVMDSGSCKTA